MLPTSHNEIIETVLVNQSNDLRQHQKIINKPGRSKVAVIVEPRSYHPLLEACVRNAMSALGEECNLEIHTGHPEFVATLFPGSDFAIIKTPPNYTRNQYSDLFMSTPFWERIQEETVIIFQTDVVFFRSIPEKFFEYDYAGANYFTPGFVSKRIGGIQGGFSIRKKKAMLECIQKITSDKVCAELQLKPFTPLPEDVYFTIACDLLNKKVPGVFERCELAIESNFCETPCAFHGFPCNYFSYNEYELLVQNSPLLCSYLST